MKTSGTGVVFLALYILAIILCGMDAGGIFTTHGQNIMLTISVMPIIVLLSLLRVDGVLRMISGSYFDNFVLFIIINVLMCYMMGILVEKIFKYIAYSKN